MLNIAHKPIITLCIAAGLASCSAPIATRVASEGRVPTAQETRYTLASPPGAGSALEQSAQSLIIEQLAQRGWRRDNANANYALTISLSERPANVGVTAKSVRGNQQMVLSAPKKRKPLQSCDDVEQRLSIAIVRLSDGARVFRGNASEYHCKASLTETLPHLVNAALSGIDQPAGHRVIERAGRE